MFGKCRWALARAVSVAIIMASPIYAQGQILTKQQMRLQMENSIAYLKVRELPDKHWAGAFISDVTQDGMLLVVGQKIGLLTRERKNELLANILNRMDGSKSGWNAYPGGPIDLNVTSFTLTVLRDFGLSEADPRVARAWSYYKSRGGDANMSTPFKLYLVALGVIDESSVSLPTPEELITTPTYLFMRKFGIIGDMFYPYIALKLLRKLPDNAWKSDQLTIADYRSRPLHIGPGSKRETIEEALGPPVHDVKLVREVIALTLRNQGTNGAWYGVCFTAFNLLLFNEAERVGLGDFREVISKAWSAAQTWQVPSEDGSQGVQPMRSDIWDTAAVLTALSYLPADLKAKTATDLKLEKSVGWLIEHRGMAKGKPNASWSFDSTDLSRPDSDDTGAALFALSRYMQVNEGLIRSLISEGTSWILRMRNEDGGFAAWSSGVSKAVFWLMEKTITFPKMADVSQADITARLAHVFESFEQNNLINVNVPGINNGICRFFEESAETYSNIPVKTFVGHWFSNYLYASSQLIVGLKSAHCDNAEAWIANLANWILSTQQNDGGWGEDNRSYLSNKYIEGRSTLAQTGLTIAGLIDAYEKLENYNPELAKKISISIEKGLQFIMVRSRSGTSYYEPDFTAILIKGLQYSRYELLPAYIGIYDFARWYEIQWNRNQGGTIR